MTYMVDAQQVKGLFQWVRNNIIATLTILGIFLYVIFWIPVTVFYARLRTTPGEVGFSYTTILSGSTLGAIIIVTVLVFLVLSVLYQIGNVIVWTSLGFYSYRMISLTLFKRVWRIPDSQLDHEQFGEKLEILKEKYKGSTPWTEVERALRRKRELERLEDRTPAEDIEKKELDSQYGDYHELMVPDVGFRLLSETWPKVIFLALMIIGTASVLTWRASADANTVRAGHSFDKSSLNLFDYHAEPVLVEPISVSDIAAIQKVILPSKRAFLLGENADYIVLYVPNANSPDKGATIRIPPTKVTLISSP